MKSDGITIKEIAELLNISGSTVSRVLSGKSKKYRISSNTERLVKETATKYNYRPNQVARNLRLQQSNTIGLVIPDISNPFFCNLALKIETELRARGKLILLCDTHDDSELEKESIQLLIDRQVDGLLVAPVGLKGDHLLHLSKPLIIIDRYFEDLDIPYVSTNNLVSSYEATQLLINNNHTNICCIQGLENTMSNKKRIDGYLKAMRESSNTENFINIIGSDFTIQNGYESTLTLIEDNNVPTAIYSLSNQITLGVLKALKEHKLQVPNDVSVVSFDDQPYFELTEPSITSVRQPVEAIGIEAVNSLFNLIDNQQSVSKLVEAELIHRASVAQPIN